MLQSSIVKILNSYENVNLKVQKLDIAYHDLVINKIDVNGKFVIMDTPPLMEIITGSSLDFIIRINEAKTTLASIKTKIEAEEMDILTEQELTLLNLKSEDVP